MIGKITKLIEVNDFLHLFVKIDKRFTDEQLFDDKMIDWANFQPLIYAADENSTNYLETPKKRGDYLKEHRKNARK